MEELNTIERHLDWLLRNCQVDLETLERERLEQLTQGLLRGQVQVFEELGRETRQSEIIASQQQLVTELQNQLSAAHASIGNMSASLAALQNHEDLYYKDTILLLADLIMRSWSTDGDLQVFETLMTGMWRAITNAITNGDIAPDSPVAGWWAALAQRNFGFHTNTHLGTPLEASWDPGEPGDEPETKPAPLYPEPELGLTLDGIYATDAMEVPDGTPDQVDNG